MMHLSWIKKNENHCAGQLYGACMIASAVALICIVKLIGESFYVPSQIILPYNEYESTDSSMAEISGETGRRGIYILPSGKVNIDQLFMAVGITDKNGIDERLLHRIIVEGDRIVIHRVFPYLMIEKMDDRTRLALDVPIDVNNAEIEELLLIPGIGLQTAEAIIESRRTKGSFSKKEDLKTINGLGSKKYERIQEHIFVGES
ncbi:MAG: helix-hairpin-helix domain-containing protein [Deltaproteobacteria bacterium]|nr:helix-hairpin-helix domain-containing protein [Deltaproteobacteria bacterium]